MLPKHNHNHNVTNTSITTNILGLIKFHTKRIDRFRGAKQSEIDFDRNSNQLEDCSSVLMTCH